MSCSSKQSDLSIETSVFKGRILQILGIFSRNPFSVQVRLDWEFIDGRILMIYSALDCSLKNTLRQVYFSKDESLPYPDWFFLFTENPFGIYIQ